ncbi:hypothetical protein [Comamonas aquatica]|uniref:hypothetical protein n=1 Tax=Comamonas aquatica TaxID=225991 RepID=UPI0024495938|nr:hypothetical protein [Comamonas aquatica]MDH0201739.1 hypothetical protein [Comamonas aquatica]MDH1446649.1 hypothetical protein [Comamonas aquatica]
MKTLIATVAAACLLASPVWAHEPAPAGKAQPAPAPQLDAHTQEDIERHRGMARAHEQAAQCLASGSKYDDCQKQLQTACKGLALGKNCGMRHAH